MPPDRSAERFIDADPTRFPTPQNFIIQLPSDDEWSTTDEEEYVPLSQPPTPEPLFFWSDSSNENIVTIEPSAEIVSGPPPVEEETIVTPDIEPEAQPEYSEPVRDEYNEVIHQLHGIEDFMPRVRRLIKDQEATITTLNNTLLSEVYNRECTIHKQSAKLQELVDKLYDSETERNLFRMQNMLLSAQLSFVENELLVLKNRQNLT